MRSIVLGIICMFLFIHNLYAQSFPTYGMFVCSGGKYNGKDVSEEIISQGTGIAFYQDEEFLWILFSFAKNNSSKMGTVTCLEKEEYPETVREYRKKVYNFIGIFHNGNNIENTICSVTQIFKPNNLIRVSFVIKREGDNGIEEMEYNGTVNKEMNWDKFLFTP